MAIIKTTQNRSPFIGDQEGSQQLVAKCTDYEYKTCTNNFNFIKAVPSGIFFIDPIPSESELGIIYPPNYEPFLFHKFPKFIIWARNFIQKKKINKLAKLISAESKIVDIGCGNGQFLKLMKKNGPTSWELYGQEVYEECSAKLKQAGFNMLTEQLEHIPKRNFFNCIVMNQVIEHFRDVNECLSSCNRIMDRNGLLFIETPSTDGLDCRLFQSGAWGGYHAPRHFFLFNEKNIEAILKQHGFKLLKVEYLASPAFWIQSFHHLFYQKNWPLIANFFTIKNPLLLGFFTFFDLVIIFMGMKTSNMRVISVKSEQVQ